MLLRLLFSYIEVVIYFRLPFRWETKVVKIGKYVDPFSVSIDISRHTESSAGSYFAIDSVHLHNCAPGESRKWTK